MACEKCWGDAYLRSLNDQSKSQPEHYLDLLLERQDNPCTPAEERGEGRGGSAGKEKGGYRKRVYRMWTVVRKNGGWILNADFAPWLWSNRKTAERFMAPDEGESVRRVTLTLEPEKKRKPRCHRQA